MSRFAQAGFAFLNRAKQKLRIRSFKETLSETRSAVLRGSIDGPQDLVGVRLSREAGERPLSPFKTTICEVEYDPRNLQEMKLSKQTTAGRSRHDTFHFRSGLLRLLFVFSCLLALSAGAIAQTADADSAGGGAPVLLDDNQVIQIKVPFKGATAEERAATVSSRILAVADNQSVDVKSVRVVETSLSSDITIGDKIVMSVLDVDAEAEGKSRADVAAQYAGRIKAAITEYRDKFGTRRILIGIAEALATTLVFVLILVLMRRIFLPARQFTVEKAANALNSRGGKFTSWLDVGKIKHALETFLNLVRFAVVAAAFLITLQLVLGFLPWTERFSSRVIDLLTGPLKVLGGALVVEIPNLFFILVVIVVTYYLLKLLRAFFAAIGNQTITFHGFLPEWASFTYKLLKVFVIIFAFIIVFPYIPGSESQAFQAISIFLGVLLSFGSTSYVANAVGGIVLTYLKAFNPGDRVKIGEYVGDVVKSTLQVTILRTIKNEEVIVPNSLIVSNYVVNFSNQAKSTGLILHTAVTIGYDTPWRQVHALLLMAAEKTEGLLAEPKPFILQTSLDDFYVTYELNVYTDNPQDMARAYSDLHTNIQDAFNEYEVQIMSPNYMMDRSEPTYVPKAKWFAAPAKPTEETDKNESKE